MVATTPRLRDPGQGLATPSDLEGIGRVHRGALGGAHMVDAIPLRGSPSGRPGSGEAAVVLGPTPLEKALRTPSSPGPPTGRGSSLTLTALKGYTPIRKREILWITRQAVRGIALPPALTVLNEDRRRQGGRSQIASSRHVLCSHQDGSVAQSPRRSLAVSSFGTSRRGSLLVREDTPTG